MFRVKEKRFFYCLQEHVLAGLLYLRVVKKQQTVFALHSLKFHIKAGLSVG